MLKNNYCELNLPENPLKSDFVLPEFLTFDDKNRYIPIDVSWIEANTKQMFEDCGLQIGGIIIFKKPHGGISPIHTDILKVDNNWIVWNCAINYNISSSNSKMLWFKSSAKQLISNISDQPDHYVLSGIHYGTFGNKDIYSKEFEIIEKHQITKPSLVRTHIPHTVINNDNHDRICLSIRFSENPSYEQVYKLMSKYIN